MRGNIAAVFLTLLAATVVFVWFSGAALPAVVATHFDVSGAADAFMRRALYLKVALVIVVALPAALVLLPAVMLRNPNARINLPNADYWLTPAHRAQAVALVRQYLARFASVLVVFFAYVHWLVLRANAANPPHFPMSWALVGLIVFAVCVLIWAKRFIGCFQNVSPENS